MTRTLATVLAVSLAVGPIPAAAAPASGALASDGRFVTDEIMRQLATLPNEDQTVAAVKTGVKALRKKKYEKANKAFQKGLRLDPSDASLHFLNGLAYHLRSLGGDATLLEKAESGYAAALKYDPANHDAAYLLGHVYFERQRYVDAQDMFAYGLLYARDDLRLLKALAATAYYTRELQVARWAAGRAAKLDPQDPGTWRASLFASAAAGDEKAASAALKRYAALDAFGAKRAERRIRDWKAHHLIAQFSTDEKAEGDDTNIMGDSGDDDYDDSQADQAAKLMPGAGDADSDAPQKTIKGVENWRNTDESKTAAPSVKLPKMTHVDVVILRSQESRSQAKGVNLLSGLQATLTGTLYAYNRVTGFSSGGASAYAQTHTIAPTFALSGLTYNLDIFNDGLAKAEVLARPSLLAVEDSSSKFFSGSTLHVQLNSNNSDGSLVDVPVGIHLNVTPSFLDADTVRIEVHAERNFIESNDSKLGFSVFSQTSKTSVDATAVLRFGETLVLSGLSESEDDSSRTGVPILQHIPGLQYLFSRKVTAQTKKSILIFLTPHKARLSGDGLKPGKDLGASLPKGRRGKHLRALREKENIVSTENIDAAFAHLARMSFYRQFRSGDLRLDFWHREDSVAGALKRSLEFLWY
jgi:general secretion pathway protein D